jgi:hypothetical protein
MKATKVTKGMKARRMSKNCADESQSDAERKLARVKAITGCPGLHELRMWMDKIAAKDGFAICSICHRSYVPKRQPAATRRNYCDDPKCRRQIWKYLKREQRRKKEERSVG